jgi:hypothetical protein
MIAIALQRRLHEYVLLTRLNRPIGTLLLLWPVLWALWIAAPGFPGTKLLLVFLLGTLLTRSAGCIINDFADRDFDPHVERTRERPLAARRISPYEALTLFVVLMLLALVVVLQLDLRTVLLSLIAALLLATRHRLRLGRADGLHGCTRRDPAARLAYFCRCGAVGGDLRHLLCDGRSRRRSTHRHPLDRVAVWRA